MKHGQRSRGKVGTQTLLWPCVYQFARTASSLQRVKCQPLLLCRTVLFPDATHARTWGTGPRTVCAPWFHAAAMTAASAPATSHVSSGTYDTTWAPAACSSARRNSMLPLSYPTRNNRQLPTACVLPPRASAAAARVGSFRSWETAAGVGSFESSAAAARAGSSEV